MSFLNKEERQKCWDDRDAYWSCLDKKSNNECNEFREYFKKSCPAQWVKHFDRKRDYLKYKERIEKEGFEPQFPEKQENV